MVDKEETPQARMEKMAVRAYELKKRREDERQSVVQEKLYQQWRESIDELRQADSKLFERRVITRKLSVKSARRSSRRSETNRQRRHCRRSCILNKSKSKRLAIMNSLSVR